MERLDERGMSVTGIVKATLGSPEIARTLLRAAAESGRLRVRSIPDRALLRRLDNIERRLNRPNWSVLAASLLLSGVLFFVNDRPVLAAMCWVAAVFLFLLTVVL